MFLSLDLHVEIRVRLVHHKASEMTEYTHSNLITRAEKLKYENKEAVNAH